jgi:hypothetical protein
MASFVFHHWQAQVQAGAKLWGTDTFKAKLLMTNTTAAAVPDAATLAEITLDECDGANYTVPTVGTPTVTDDDAGNSVQLHAAAMAFGSVGAGTRASKGVLIYDDTDAGDMPAIWIEFAAPITHDGTAFSVEENAAGLAKLAC